MSDTNNWCLLYLLGPKCGGDVMMVNCEYIRSLGAASSDLPLGALYSSFVTMMPALACYIVR